MLDTRIIEVNARNDFHALFNGYGDFGSFKTALMKTISNADLSNLKRLKSGFPVLVNEYLVFQGWNEEDIKNV